MRTHNRLLAQSPDKLKPHIGDCRFPVKPGFLLHDRHDLLKCFLLIFCKLQCILDRCILLNQLCCSKPHRKIGFLRIIFNHMRNRMDTAMHRSNRIFVILTVRAEINSSRRFMVSCHMHGMAYQFVDTFILRSRDWHHRNSKYLLELIDTDRTTVRPYLIHHIQCKHHRDSKLHQLHRQTQIPF